MPNEELENSEFARGHFERRAGLVSPMPFEIDVNVADTVLRQRRLGADRQTPQPCADARNQFRTLKGFTT